MTDRVRAVTFAAFKVDSILFTVLCKMLTTINCGYERTGMHTRSGVVWITDHEHWVNSGRL